MCSNCSCRTFLLLFFFAEILGVSCLTTFSQIKKTRNATKLPPLVKSIELEQFSVEQGLPGAAVNRIARDSIGFMWFATRNGLYRYDGYQFKAYKYNPSDTNSLSGNNVMSLCIEHSGTLWAGIEGGGLNMYDVAKDLFRRLPPSTLSDPTVYDIYEDRAQVLWVGTMCGLNKYDPDSQRSICYYLDPNDRRSGGTNGIFGITERRNGELWISPGGQAVGFAWLNKNSDSLTPSIGISEQINNWFYEDMSSTVWLGYSKGLISVRSDRDSIRHLPYYPFAHNNLGNFSITGAHSDRRGSLILSSGTRGFIRFDPMKEEFTELQFRNSDPNSINAQYLGQLYGDERSGLLWAGSTVRGSYKLNLNRKQFALFKNDLSSLNSLHAGEVRSVLQDHSGEVWIGVTASLDQYTPETSSFIHHDQNLDVDVIGALFEESDGRLWAGTATGSVIELDKTRERIRYHTKTKAFDIRGLYRNESGILWIAGRRFAGLIKYDPSGEHSDYFDPIGTSAPWNSRCMIKSRNGDLWIGDQGSGLWQFHHKTETFSRFDHQANNPQSLGDIMILSVFEDHEGIIWVGTPNGLDRLDTATHTFTHYRTSDGLASGEIMNIQEDRKGNLWLRTAKGITKFDVKNNKFKNYDISDFSVGAFEITRNSSKEGVLFFPLGTDGFVTFHPDSIRDNPNIPPIVLTDFKIGNKSVSPRDPNSPLKQTIWTAKEITLDYKDNMMSFDFAALDYTNPAKNQYAYKMEGFDNDWIYSGTRRTATYTNLDPGDYTFRVKGSNNDDVWNETGTSLRVTILPPWYRTWWAYLLYVMLAFAGLFTYRRYDLKQINLKNESKIAQAESRKLKEVDEMKSRFFANISHEFRTPLTLILGPIQKWRHSLNPEERSDEGSPAGMKDEILRLRSATAQDVEMMERNAHRLLRLINQLLDLSKFDAGKMALQLEELDVAELVREVASSFDSLSTAKGIEYSVDVDHQSLIGMFDRDKVENILTNLLSNAFKFTKEGGKVTVTLRLRRDVQLNVPTEGDYLEIAVHDTGIGIAANKLEKIFDRFYQVNDEATRDYEGTGIGLALTKEFVEHHGGTITVESEVGKGTRFVVTLPLGREHLKDYKVVETLDIKRRIGEGAKGREGESLSDRPLSHSPALPISLSVRDSQLLAQTIGQIAPLVLIIEDNADMRSYIRSVLGSNWVMHEAQDGEAGVAKAKEEIPDLIICDVMMPKMDGFQVCKELKHDEKTSHIPIIMLTAKAALENKLEGLELGADDYLSKPFEPKELLARARNLIELRRELREKFSVAQPLKPGEIAVTSVDDAFLQKVKAVVERQMEDENFSVEELASEVAMSRMQLHRKLTALTNQSASEFIRYLRLHRAKQMLEQDGGNVSDVAYSVGFGSPAHFAKCFKEQFGVAPSEVAK